MDEFDEFDEGIRSLVAKVKTNFSDSQTDGIRKIWKQVVTLVFF